MMGEIEKEEEEEIWERREIARRKKNKFGNLGIWIPYEMGWIHGSGHITHFIWANPLENGNQKFFCRNTIQFDDWVEFNGKDYLY